MVETLVLQRLTHSQCHLRIHHCGGCDDYAYGGAVQVWKIGKKGSHHLKWGHPTVSMKIKKATGKLTTFHNVKQR